MAMCSDHFSPGAAARDTPRTRGLGSAPRSPRPSTSRLRLRPRPALPPGGRGPEAVATLGSMFPGRFWVALGSGEASNEHITGDVWPDKETRTNGSRSASTSSGGCSRARRSATRGWSASTVPGCGRSRTHDPGWSDRQFGRQRAPGRRWSEGMVTVNQPSAQLRDLVEAHRAAGGPVRCASRSISRGRRPRQAEQIAHEQWRSNVFGEPVAWDLETVDAFDVVSGDVTVEKVRTVVESPPTWTSTATGWPGTPTWGSTRSTSTTWGRTRPLHRRVRGAVPADAAKGPSHAVVKQTRATCGGRRRSSTASTSRPTRTPTVTGSGTSRD